MVLPIYLEDMLSVYFLLFWRIVQNQWLISIAILRKFISYWVKFSISLYKSILWFSFTSKEDSQAHVDALVKAFEEDSKQ